MNRFALPKELQPTEADKKAQQRKEIIKALEAWKLFFKVVSLDCCYIIADF